MNFFVNNDTILKTLVWLRSLPYDTEVCGGIQAGLLTETLEAALLHIEELEQQVFSLKMKEAIVVQIHKLTEHYLPEEDSNEHQKNGPE